MKKLLLIGIPILLLGAGGGIYAAMKAGIGPFHHPAKAAGKAAAAQPAPAATTPTAAADTASDTAATQRAAKPQSKPKPADDAAATDDPDAEQRLAKLTSVYEQMPAEDAGKIMAKLLDSLVQQLLSRMDERQAGKVLLTLDVNRAAKLTRALARAPGAAPEPDVPDTTKPVRHASNEQPAATPDTTSPAAAPVTTPVAPNSAPPAIASNNGEITPP